MEHDYRNIYRDARVTAGLTQERWAELLGISPDAVRQYETDKITPSDAVALRMAEATGQQIICYWHLLHKSRAAAQLLPSVERGSLPQAVLDLIVLTEDFQEGGMKTLARLAADGKISADERRAYDEVLEQLRGLIAAALRVQFAEEE